MRGEENEVKKILAALVAGIMSLAYISILPAFAAELHVTGFINSDGVVTISGYANPGYVSVELIRGEEEAVIAVYAGREVEDSVLADAAVVGEDGAFTMMWQLPPSEAELPAAERIYTAVISNTDTYTELSERTLPLYFALDEEIDRALAEVAAAVAAESVTELSDTLEKNANALQITGILRDSIYVQNTEEVLESVLAQGKEQPFTGVEALQIALDMAMGVAAFNTADSGTFASVIQTYAEVLQLDTTQYYTDDALRAAMRSCVASVLQEYDLKLPEDAPEAFQTVEAVAAVNIAARGDVLDVIADYTDIFELDTDSLSASERNTVAAKLCVSDASRAYGTVQAVRKAFQDALDTEGSSGGNGTSTGGGSGSRGPGGSAVSPVLGGTGLVEIQPAESPEEEDKAFFTDLDSVPWAVTCIETLARAGIVNGKQEGVFDPEASVTREEFTKMLALAMELPEAAEAAGFIDVEEEAWYAPYVNAASEAGLLQGYDDGSFGIGFNISREEAATLIARAADYAQCEITPAEALTFEDTLEISEFAVDAVKLCQGAQIVQGNEQNQFLPRNPITRAECAKMIFCLMELL